MRTLLAPLALGLLCAPAPAQDRAPTSRARVVIRCTPKTVVVGRARAVPAQNPIAYALERAGPGSVITLGAGDYPPFGVGFRKAMKWNARCRGGTRNDPIVVQGEGRVRIRARKSGDTISFSQEIKNGHYVFRNLEIEPGYRAGLFFFKGGKGGWIYDGYHFLDCDIVGRWDHAANRGQTSKWGVWGHSMADFVFKGVRGPAVVKDIRTEHGFYLQTPKGDITIENVHASRLGRTFCQFTARAKDGAIGVGKITVRNCRIEDVCIARGDDFKGGSAITFGGRLSGTLLLENNVYRSGFDAGIRKLTRKDIPFGTGALACWQGGEKVPNGKLILRDNDFEIAPGCGDRPLLSIGGVREVSFEGANRFVAGASGVAVDLEPSRNGKVAGAPLEKLSVSPGTSVRGAFRRRGEIVSKDERAKLAGTGAARGH